MSNQEMNELWAGKRKPRYRGLMEIMRDEPIHVITIMPVVIQGPTEDIPYEDVTPKQLEEK